MKKMFTKAAVIAALTLASSSVLAYRYELANHTSKDLEIAIYLQAWGDAWTKVV